MRRESDELSYDIIMLAVLVGCTLYGGVKGMAWQVASLTSLVLSYFVALGFSDQLAPHIGMDPPLNRIAAMLVLYVGSSAAVWVAFRLVAKFIDRVKLKEFDRQLGALFGAAKGMLLCVLVTLFSVALLGDTQRQAICNSKSGYYIAMFLDRADVMIPRELHDVLAPYLDRFDRSVPHPHTADGSLPPPATWGAASLGPSETGQPRTAGWQQELEAVFGGQGKPSTASPQSSFPTGEAAFQPEFTQPHTAGRIDAQPAQSGPPGSFRRW